MDPGRIINIIIKKKKIVLSVPQATISISIYLIYFLLITSDERGFIVINVANRASPVLTYSTTNQYSDSANTIGMTNDMKYLFVT